MQGPLGGEHKAGARNDASSGAAGSGAGKPVEPRRQRKADQGIAIDSLHSVVSLGLYKASKAEGETREAVLTLV